MRGVSILVRRWKTVVIGEVRWACEEEISMFLMFVVSL